VERPLWGQAAWPEGLPPICLGPGLRPPPPGGPLVGAAPCTPPDYGGLGRLNRLQKRGGRTVRGCPRVIGRGGAAGRLLGSFRSFARVLGSR